LSITSITPSIHRVRFAIYVRKGEATFDQIDTVPESGVPQTAEQLLHPRRSSQSGQNRRSAARKNGRGRRASHGAMKGLKPMDKRIAVVLYVVAMAAVIVGIDLVFFRNRFWERLMVNIGIVLVFAAFYLRFLMRP
jgi:hypothetical protein